MTYGPKDLAMRKRIAKAHSRAKFAGVLYLLGTIALAVLAFLPLLIINGNQEKALGATTFYKPFLDLGKFDIAMLPELIVAVLFGLILITVVINVFKALSKLGWLMKKSTRYVNGVNRNMRAMEKLGKIFSGSLAALINFYLLIFVFSAAVEVELTMYAYIALGAGLAVHFLAGLIAGKVSLFTVDGTTQEEKRECGLFVYFIRNLLQVVAVAAILYLMVSPMLDTGYNFVAALGSTINGIIVGAITFADLLQDIALLIYFALNVVLLISVFVLVKHATAATEYNRDGMNGKGMKNFRVFSFIAFLVSLGAFVVYNMMILKIKAIGDVEYTNDLLIAGVALVIFLVDCIVKSREKKCVEESEECFDGVCAPVQAPQAVQAPTGMPMAPAPNVMPMPAPAAAQNAQQPMYSPVFVQQPQANPTTVYVPMPYPYMYPGYGMPPAPPAAPAPVAAPAPAPAAAPVCDRPRCCEIMAEKKTAVDTTAEDVEEYDELDEPLKGGVIPPAPKGNYGPAPVLPEFPDKFSDQMLEAKCPNCGKALTVREGAPAHRCPGCEKVFSIVKRKRARKLGE